MLLESAHPTRPLAAFDLLMLTATGPFGFTLYSSAGSVRRTLHVGAGRHHPGTVDLIACGSGGRLPHGWARDLTERKGAATMARQARGTTEICPCLRGDLKKLARHMRDLGWTFEQGKHCKVFAPDGASHTSLSCTPSDVTSYRNSRAVFRRWCRDNLMVPPV